MPFLFEDVDAVKRYGGYKDLPQYIPDNLNPTFELRPYQDAAFRHFITYFEGGLRKYPAQTLFHMATGSGKTLIMAGLMLYLYEQGYRNFLFFVNLSNIVRKTKENFLSEFSTKYLFAPTLRIGEKKIKIKEVQNFQSVDEDSINVCFTTMQGLHYEMNTVKENGVSFDDFKDKKIVLISDEAHHLSASTKGGEAEERDNVRHWEDTVSRIFKANRENVLLEFTATCDLKNEVIKAKYTDKIIFDYPLSKFREDLYSKEIKALRSDSPVFERALQAAILSQYRLKLFQDNRLQIKPVVMFKSNRVKENIKNMSEFLTNMARLTGEKVRETLDNVRTQAPIMQAAYEYFLKNGISFDRLAQELKEDFSALHCISANEDKEVEENQLLLNSLEDKTNPYRAVFAVDKLNEGWDVLNLFDIVRLYETRVVRDGKPGAGTIAEAQLIGRGARYCPFQIEPQQSKCQRKYDSDADNPLRICETLYYHCWNEPRYISELHIALREVGLDIENTVTWQYTLKEEFQSDEWYRSGYLFINGKTPKEESVSALPDGIRNKEYAISIATGKGGEDVVFDALSLGDAAVTHTYRATFGMLAKENYALVYRALRQFDAFSFRALQTRFEKLRSLKEFIQSAEYLGGVRLCITSKQAIPPLAVLYKACVRVLAKIAAQISALELVYEGSSAFTPCPVCELIKEKSVTYTPVPGGKGVSQNDVSVDPASRIDLSKEDWFAFNDNYGTSEEKAFVKYIRDCMGDLRSKYDKAYLVRNERQMHLYSFDTGERFEPDYIFYLRKQVGSRAEHTLVYIEPKGEHLIATEAWKEKFLLELEKRAVLASAPNGEKYRLCGFHFFNRDCRGSEFDDDMKTL